MAGVRTIYPKIIESEQTVQDFMGRIKRVDYIRTWMVNHLFIIHFVLGMLKK